VRTWWRRRSLRARLTLIATAALAGGFAAGSLLLLHAFAASRFHAIDGTSRTVSSNVSALVTAGALPQILPVEAGQTAQVLTSTGAVLAASPGSLRTLPLLPLGQVAGLADTGPRNLAVDSIDSEGQSRVLVRSVAVGGSKEYVVIAVSLSDERDTTRGLAHVLAVAAPSLLIIVAATLWLLLGSALGAVTELRVGAESITDPASAERLPLPSSQDEIHHLAVTLNDMIDRLAAASARERGFIADAAHELRSPVAAMQTQLEVAVATGDSTARRELTEGALRDVERLAALVQDLLALARLESASPLPAARVDLAALAGVAGKGPCVVRGDATTLSRAIDNLRVNAEHHARSRVAVSVSGSNGTVEVSVDDDGAGVAPQDRDRIFERFVRLDVARARTQGGTGLGLSIVKATAQAHGGTVTVHDSAYGGARFTLSLPAADQPAAVTTSG
jgi:signal transduction histidine kinase